AIRTTRPRPDELSAYSKGELRPGHSALADRKESRLKINFCSTPTFFRARGFLPRGVTHPSTPSSCLEDCRAADSPPPRAGRCDILVPSALAVSSRSMTLTAPSPSKKIKPSSSCGKLGVLI